MKILQMNTSLSGLTIVLFASVFIGIRPIIAQEINATQDTVVDLNEIKISLKDSVQYRKNLLPVFSISNRPPILYNQKGQRSAPVYNSNGVRQRKAYQNYR